MFGKKNTFWWVKQNECVKVDIDVALFIVLKILDT